MFSSLDDNLGGGDSHSISEAAHKLVPPTQNKHKPTLSSDKCPYQPAVTMRVQLARVLLGWEVRTTRGCTDWGFMTSEAEYRTWVFFQAP